MLHFFVGSYSFQIIIAIYKIYFRIMVKRKLEIDVENIFSQLSKRLAGPRDDYFVGQEENLSFLLDLVTRTVDKGEGNSILVLGPHGVGKTALGK